MNYWNCADEKPAKIVDLFLALEAKVAELEKRLNKNSQNSDKPPSSDGLRRPPRQRSKSKRSRVGNKVIPGKRSSSATNQTKSSSTARILARVVGQA